ncbi:MAG: HlyC/CorC family transporter [Lachnospiraceae bacterium]|nr:HlyC/CorC family transporter [Lachnospiraceae bacterium]
MDINPWAAALIITFITIFDFFVALAKSAFEHVSLNELKNLSEEGNEKAKNALEFIDRHENSFYNACWLIRGIAWIFIGMLFISSPLKAIVAGIDIYWIQIAVGIIVSLAVIFLVILFTYILPDRLANRNTESIFFSTFSFMKFITFFFKPLSALLEGCCALVLLPFGIKLKDLEENVTEEEIISIVNEGQEQGVIDDDEAEMISNIISFDEKQTKDIMTHRTKIVAVDSELGIEEAMGFMAGEAFSRYPLYTEDIDNIIGVLHLKDVAKCYASGEYKNKTLKDIARKPFFVPDTMTIDELFNQMQVKKNHMAIVIDEYGQTAGIVAMEDILEEIVGDIEDEFDNEEQMIIKAKDGSYILRGEATLNEVSEETDISIKESDLENFDTVNGLIISLLDRIPSDGERENVSYGDYTISILEVKNKMIRKCRVTGGPKKETGEKAGS